MDNVKMINGEKINLCVLNKELHLNNCYRWMNNPLINRMLSTGVFPIDYQSEINWFEKLKTSTDVILAIATKEEKHIGNIGLHKIDYISRIAVLGIVIGDKEEWGKGFASEAESLMLNYAFQTLNLHKVTAEIFAENIASLKAAKKNGATIEGTFKKHLYKNGEYHDLIQIAFFKD